MLAGGNLDLWIFFAPGTAHDVPAVAGGRRSVDDQYGTRAAACRFFILVRPAAVVGQGAAAEEFRIFRWRLIREQNGDLTLEVGPFEIVPLELGSVDPVANEH